MRSKNTRIVVTGGILTLLTLCTLRHEADLGGRAVSQNNQTVSTRASAPMTDKNCENVAVSPVSLANNKALFAYVGRPTNADRVEKGYPAPTHDIRYARVDEIAAGNHSPLSRIGGRVELQLPNGMTLPIVVEHTQTIGESRFVSDGEIEGGRGHASFAYNDGELSGTIDINEGGAWQVRAIGNSVAQVFQVDSALVPPCGTDNAIHTSQPNVAATGTSFSEQETGDVAGDIPYVSGVLAPNVTVNVGVKSTIHILVPYSQAITRYISSNAVISSIDLAVYNLNQDLARSAIPVNVVLTGTPAENYSQDGSDPSYSAIDNALTRITSPTDGVLDGVHALRYDTHSDLVCFTINQIDSTNSGVGYILATPNSAFNATYGFSVVSFAYLNANRTFSHEIGHNLGCDHDRENAYSTSGGAASGTYPYSYGYRFYGKDGHQYHDIMSYPPGQTVAYFSNPNLIAPTPLNVPVGAPIGSSGQAYNALTITENAVEVSNYHANRMVFRAASLTRGKN